MRKPRDYRCENDHIFEAWLSSDTDWRESARVGELRCPFCQGFVLERLPCAPNFKRVEGTTRTDVNTDFEQRQAHKKQEEAQAHAYRALKAWVASAKDVGTALPQEARRQREATGPKVPLKGQCSPQEAERLWEEGIPVVPLPKHLTDKSN